MGKTLVYAAKIASCWE